MTMPTIRPWVGLCYGNNTFVCFTNNSNTFAYSTDNGTTWTETSTTLSTRNWYSMIHDGTEFVVIAHNSKYIARSSDGINWTESEVLNYTSQWDNLVYGNGLYVAVGFAKSTVEVSTEKVTWTEYLIVKGDTTTRQWRGATFLNGMFILLTDNFPSYYAFSYDGMNWISGKMPTPHVFYDICAGQNKFVACTFESNN